MSEEKNNNGFLYFAVGALFIAVIGLGFYMSSDAGSGDLTLIESAGGQQDDNPDFQFKMNDNGVEATTNSE